VRWLDRRFYALVLAGWALAACYRIVLRRTHEDLSTWTAFVVVWLPCAILIGLAIAYGVPALARWWSRRR
jgi:hypothetical protein